MLKEVFLVPGCRLLVAGCWLLVAGYWLLVAGCGFIPTVMEDMYPAQKLQTGYRKMLYRLHRPLPAAIRRNAPV
jgi:hypothetical protein